MPSSGAASRIEMVGELRECTSGTFLFGYRDVALFRCAKTEHTWLLRISPRSSGILIRMGAESKETPRSTRGDQAAKAWAMDRAGEFGRAVARHRGRLGLSAVELSNRTREIGYPITRSAIAKIESNSRNGKFDVAEVVTLATALEVAPAQLIFPEYPEGTLWAVPKDQMKASEAWEWMVNGDDFNQWDGLRRPRVTQSRELFDAIRDYRDAISAFERRYAPTPVSSEKWNFIVPSEHLNASGAGPSSSAKFELSDEYDRIKSLRASVLELGGSVALPEWIDIYFGETGPF